MTTKTIARWTAIGALFLIPFLSLYVSNGMFFPFITGKNFVFRALVEIAAAAWLVLIACDKVYRPRFSWTLVWYKLLVVWMVVANFMALNPHKAFWSNYERMDGWVTLVHLYILFVVMASVLSAEKLWRKWWLAFIAANALVCVHGLMQVLGAAQIHQGSTRIDASLGNAEYFAGYLLFAIAVTVWQAFETRTEKQKWLRYGLFALAAIQLVLLFNTGTRGTLIGLVAGGMFGSALWIFEAGKQGRKIAASVLAILVLLVGGLYVARDSAFVKGSENINRLASVFELKEALGPRLIIWDMAIEGIHERPVFGWGQEGFNYVFNKYYDPRMYAQEPWFDRAHNVFLDWAIAGGIPAVLLFIAVLLTAAFSLYRSKVSRYERILLLSALVAYAVQGLAVFDNLFTYIPFVAILAMAHTSSSRPMRMFERTREVTGSNLDTLVAPAAIIVGVAALWMVNMPSVLASANLIDALTPSNQVEARLSYFKAAVENDGLGHQEITEQLLSFASQAAVDGSLSQSQRQQIVDYAGEQMNAELLQAPEDARLHLQYALFLRSINAYTEAQQESSVARSLSPKKQSIILEQGIEAFQQGQYPAAKEYFTQAYELNTENTEMAMYIAAAEIASKNVAGGKATLQQTFGTTTVTHPMVVLAYYQIRDWNNLIEVLREKVRQTNDVNDEFQLAAAYSQAGRRDDAIAAIRETIVRHPEATSQGQSFLQQLGAK
jgi:O-antigen ligase